MLIKYTGPLGSVEVPGAGMVTRGGTITVPDDLGAALVDPERAEFEQVLDEPAAKDTTSRKRKSPAATGGD